MPSDFSAYLTPDFKNPMGEMAPSPITGLPAGLDPIWGPISRMIFGKKDKSPDWIEKDGFMHHKSGQYAPVPISDVYGTAKTPSKAYRQTAENVRMLEDFFPMFSKAIAGQIIPQEQAKLAAAQVTSPQFAELMKNLYATYGPQLNKIGSDIATQNAMDSAARDAAVLRGPGKDVIAEALAAMRTADPEFFKTRELTSDRLADLMKSIDIEGGLNDSERREIEQGLVREGQRRGTVNAPSQSEVVSSGMRYGQAGRERVLQNQSALSNAIQASTQFLPASRTGFDPFQVATGKPSGPNTGEGKFTGISMPGQEAYGLANSLFGNIGQNSTQQADIGANAKLAEKDWLDQFSQFTGALSNLGGLMGGAMMCWVAREVFGNHDARWIIFRQWMLAKAPRWLNRLYRKYGQRFAWWIHDKPRIKNIIRKLMNNVIERNYTYGIA